MSEALALAKGYELVQWENHWMRLWLENLDIDVDAELETQRLTEETSEIDDVQMGN